MSEIEGLAERILAARRRLPASRALLAAVTGIDGSGKGWVTARLAAALEASGARVAAINIDGWLNLPHVRFAARDPAGHFYRHAIRFDALFGDLVLPLRDHGSVRLEAEYAEETATEYRRHLYAYERIEVIVLEGIFLLKRSFQALYDLSAWIDCGFETALERAVARAQEGLPPEQTAEAYRRIYFPAQEIHIVRDAPRAAATVILLNDPRLEAALGRAGAPAIGSAGPP